MKRICTLILLLLLSVSLTACQSDEEKELTRLQLEREKAYIAGQEKMKKDLQKPFDWNEGETKPEKPKEDPIPDNRTAEQRLKEHLENQEKEKQNKGQ